MGWYISFEVETSKGNFIPVDCQASGLNYTHNTNPILVSIGFLDHEKSWSKYDGMDLASFREAIHLAIKNMKKDESLNRYDSDNGWGSYTGLLACLESIYYGTMSMVDETIVRIS